MKNATKLFPLLAALLALFVSPVLAQTSGSISGEVKDEKQAVVTNATVTVRNVKTNETRTTSTDGDGRYRFTGMKVGDTKSLSNHPVSPNTCSLESVWC